MKRFHVHVVVNDLQESTRFYSTMFGVEPTVLKPDYAKWMLDDPRVNFAISQRGENVGVNHLGVQAETANELEAIHANLQRADRAVLEEKGVSCCYAKSDKYWVTDPQGIAWETFRSLGSVPFYGKDGDAAPAACGSDQESGCCTPPAEAAAAAKATGCCATACLNLTVPARVLRREAEEPPIV